MVLDPVTALGVAGNVLQFVDFTSKVVSRGTQYYKSPDGALVENTQLSAVARNLRRLSHGLRFSMPRVREPGESLAEYTAAEQGLWDANNECHKISVELIEVLDKLKVKSSSRKWQSFRQALRSSWSEERIETLSNRLDQAREQLMTHLLVHISSQQGFDRNAIIKNANVFQENILDAIELSLHSSRALESKVTELSRSLGRAKAKDRAHIVIEWQGGNRPDLDQLSEDLYQAADSAHLLDVEDQLLNSLYFTRLEERRARIAEAHQKTFKWIFGGVREDGTRWDEFALWLESQITHKGLFWISGKAGSGKSTLMRYLNDNVNTRVCLQRWAGSERLIIASCFFWKAGTPMQRSLTGMLRSLLHQMLQCSRKLIPDVSPWRWRSVYWGPSDLEDWTDVELVEAMRNFVRLAQPTMRIALFVDGLDEFEGDDGTTQYLIDLFQSLAAHPGVKICVSSRPWNIFRDAFAEYPKLRLELLTLEDIRIYVQDNLDTSPRFLKLSKTNPLGCHTLVADVVEKATGVFLWVYLVVRELTKGLRNGYDLRMLHKRLDALPADLDAFFLRMIDSIELIDRPIASRVFQILLAEKTVPTLMTLAFIDEDILDYALDNIRIHPSLASITDTNEAMQRRINHLSMGLLETTRPLKALTDEGLGEAKEHEFSRTWKWEVNYLHRTVKEFLLSEQSQKLLLTFTDGKYDVVRYLCNAALSQMLLASALPFASDSQRYLVATHDLSYLFFEFLEVFMETVEATEDSQEVPSVFLLKNAEAVFLKYISALDMGTFNIDNRFESRAWESLLEWDNWNCSFLTLTLQFNIEGLYDALSKAECYALQISKHGRPLLDFALRRWASNPKIALPPKPRLIERLLVDGADPAEIFRDDSIWGHWLTSVRDGAIWYQTTELLISYGALNSKYQTSGQPTPWHAILDARFGEAATNKLLNTPVKTPPPPRRLVKPLGNRRKSSLRDKLLSWRKA